MAEATLIDVVDELRSVNDNLDNVENTQSYTGDLVSELTNTTISMFKMFDRKFEEDKFDREEARRENRSGQGVPGMVTANQNAAPNSNAEGTLMAVLRGTFLGKMAANIAKWLTPITVALTANILKPLIFIGKSIARTGPIGLLVTSLFAVFHDIGQNEEFKAAIEGIKELWTNNIVPTWRNLKEAFEGFMSTDAMVATMNTIEISWDAVVVLFGQLKGLVQGVFIDSINLIVDAFTVLTDSINMALNGDPLGAAWNLVTGGIDMMVNFWTDIGDRIGEFFGLGSTVFSDFLASSQTAVVVIKDKISSFFTALGLSFVGWWDDIKATMSLKISNAKDSVVNGIQTGVDFAADIFDSIQGTFRRMKITFDNTIDNIRIGFMTVGTTLQNIPDRLMRMIGNILDFEIPKIAIPYDNFILGKGEVVLFDGGKPFSAAGEMSTAANTRINGRNNALNESITKIEADMAQRLAILNAENTALGRSGSNGNVTVVAPTTANNVQNNSTTIHTNPSPFDRSLVAPF